MLNVQVVEMEADVLKTLDYEVGNPTIKTFLRSVLENKSPSGPSNLM